jgi:hypothetical protein
VTDNRIADAYVGSAPVALAAGIAQAIVSGANCNEVFQGNRHAIRGR